jgi:hypothetical protein
LREGLAVTDKAAELPRYLSDTADSLRAKLDPRARM